MKLRIINSVVVMAAVTGWAAACNVQQARPVCLTGHGDYAVKYILKSGQPTGTCAEKVGEILGVQKYNAPPSATNPDPDQTIAFKPETLVDNFDSGAAPGQAETAFIATGKLTAGDPDAQNFCTAPTLSTVSAPAGSGSDVAYAFTNVKFYVTANTPGTQFKADLAYTEGGCTANYTVIGLYPALGCDDGSGKPDQSACEGTGINPDFPVKCDATTLLCMLDATDVPSVKPGKTP